MIGAMNLRMAVLATSPHHPCVRKRTRRKASTGQEVVHVTDHRVALLTQYGPGRDQELFVIGTVGLMATETILAYRSMFENERSALLGMAAITGLVDGCRFQEDVIGTAVRVVAIDAAHFAFRQRHVRPPAELGPLILMTLETCLVDGLLRKQPSCRQLRHGIVTVAASYVLALVNGIQPVNPLAAIVTLQALSVLLGYGIHTGVRKPNDGCGIEGVFHVE